MLNHRSLATATWTGQRKHLLRQGGSRFSDVSKSHMGSCRYLMGGLGLLGAGTCPVARYLHEMGSTPDCVSRLGSARGTGEELPAQCQAPCAFAIDTAFAALGPD